MENIEFDDLLDAKGLLCPEPVMMLHSKIADVDSGSVLKVEATDPSTQRDIAKFCQFLGHELLEAKEIDKTFVFWIKKAS